MNILKIVAVNIEVKLFLRQLADPLPNIVITVFWSNEAINFLYHLS